MSVESFAILLLFSVFSAGAPLLILLINLRSTFSSSVGRVLFFLAGLWLLVEILNTFFGYNGLNTNLNFHIFDLLSTVLYLIYFKSIFKEQWERKALDIIMVIYVIITVSTIIVKQAYFVPVMTNLALTMLLPFLLSLLSFYRIARTSRVTNLIQEPNYWINSAILIHFGMSIVGSLISDVLYNNLNLHLFIWPFVIVSNIFYNILFSVAAWKMRRT